jgi:hypothetical protein
MSVTESTSTVPAQDDEPLRTGEAELSRDDVFELLSNHRRRYALHHLQNNGERAELGEISEHVAAWENDIEVGAVSSAERKRVYTSLQQFHLPKMDDHGVVSFDDRSGTVELEPVADDIDVYLEVVESQDIPWSLYYLSLGGATLGLLLLNALGVAPFSMLSDISLGIFVATTFLVSSVVHTYLTRTQMRLGESERPPELEE